MDTRVEGLSERPVQSMDDVEELLEEGNKRRQGLELETTTGFSGGLGIPNWMVQLASFHPVELVDNQSWAKTGATSRPHLVSGLLTEVMHHVPSSGPHVWFTSV